MSTIRMALMAALAAGATASCYQESAYAQPVYPQPQEVSGPPGGEMDPYEGQQAPEAQPAPDPGMDPGVNQGDVNAGYDPNAQQGYVDPNAQQGYVDPNAQQGYVDPNAQDPNATGPVTDAQIDATLDGYGSWESDPDYGQVWYPSTTVVGVDFTPYETCGSWVWSDSGWMYNCDWSWGWLPFHYGRWGWFGGRWGWVRGYNWGPAWVDWRYGGGYVGWRPMEPGNWHVRDHRHYDSQWRFAGENDFGRGHIRGHLFNNPAEGLRVTSAVTRPPVRGLGNPVRAASLMPHVRPAMSWGAAHPTTGPRTPGQPGFRQPAQRWGQPQQQAWRQPQQPQQAWRQPQQQWRVPQQTWHQPVPQQQWRVPQQTWHQPVPQQQWRQPQQAYRPPVQSYRPPMQSYRPPVQSYRPPMQSYRPPVQSYRPSYSAPSRSFSAPSRSFSAPSHSYSAPSHSFGGGGGGGFHSSGGGGGFHGGGGGHHR